MDDLPPRNLTAETALHHRPLCCYADATGYGRIGTFTPANNMHPAYFGFSKIKFREHTDLIHINLLELIASASALHTFSQYHSGAVMIFTDNTTVQYLIHKGSSASTTVNEAISDFWLHTAAVGPSRLFALRVPSYSNPADAVSRQQFSAPWLCDAIRLPIAFPPWVSKYDTPKEATSLA
ncbi:hypothetical protein Pmar_PMAR021253 [Perkinsus marinus ATCC 50983]|uniref:RNase H type-1 domain-containing protein n=1 Tax=Perkinsus marinus (strain ATCC 50983 / TXsc) TaxID=423536 RepID=C5LZJ3_PERM5|nr:hypothetical protein Pmar_PMAR021253 [Perkinsus marinus ATCC 50983]EEQ97849.1 hypothetical protein Pmar_PMAR021253 [Perkinsus marinus ATCC 50983]|eukprot:XP_002765132.1 hypothetical protein Pmar_PMAR021253 [Perkinsus marinus ATCC 50983]